MDVYFGDDDLQDLETNPEAKSRFSKAVVKAYRQLMRIVRDAVDERDLRKLKSLHFEKMKGKRSHQCSLRINDQWRLVIEIEKGNPKNVIRVIKIEDYH